MFFIKQRAVNMVDNSTKSNQYWIFLYVVVSLTWLSSSVEESAHLKRSLQENVSLPTDVENTPESLSDIVKTLEKIRNLFKYIQTMLPYSSDQLTAEEQKELNVEASTLISRAEQIMDNIAKTNSIDDDSLAWYQNYKSYSFPVDLDNLEEVSTDTPSNTPHRNTQEPESAAYGQPSPFLSEIPPSSEDALPPSIPGSGILSDSGVDRNRIQPITETTVQPEQLKTLEQSIFAEEFDSLIFDNGADSKSNTTTTLSTTEQPKKIDASPSLLDESPIATEQTTPAPNTEVEQPAMLSNTQESKTNFNTASLIDILQTAPEPLVNSVEEVSKTDNSNAKDNTDQIGNQNTDANKPKHPTENTNSDDTLLKESSFVTTQSSFIAKEVDRDNLIQPRGDFENRETVIDDDTDDDNDDDHNDDHDDDHNDDQGIEQEDKNDINNLESNLSKFKNANEILRRDSNHEMFSLLENEDDDEVDDSVANPGTVSSSDTGSDSNGGSSEGINGSSDRSSEGSSDKSGDGSGDGNGDGNGDGSSGGSTTNFSFGMYPVSAKLLLTLIIVQLIHLL